MIIKTNRLKEVFFCISVIIVSVYILSGIFAFFDGYDVGLFGYVEPGVDALINAYIWNFVSYGFFIPVIPISIIYIIYYLSKKKRK